MGLTLFRHDLGKDALIGHVEREGDDGGPLVALWIDDEAAAVKVGLRIRTPEQAAALVEVALIAQAILAEETMPDLGRREIEERRDEPRPEMQRRAADREKMQ